MDFFEVYPELESCQVDSLQGRQLRLIALSGLVYDQEAFYFEFGRRRYWGQSREGQPLIGIGAPRIQPDGEGPPQRGLVRYLEKVWRCEVTLFPANHTYLVDEDERLSVLTDVGAHVPYMLLMTAPRLGGANVPDALVRAVYLMPKQRLRKLMASIELLRIAREAFSDFIAPDHWALDDLRSKSWADVITDGVLPPDAQIRPVMALRAIRTLMLNEDLPGIPGP
jgi:hypothetical protein